MDVYMRFIPWVVALLLLMIHTFFFCTFLSTKSKKEKWEYCYILSKVAVLSTEQILGAGNGTDKKEEVILAMKLLAKSQLNNYQIDKLVEAAVYVLNHQKDNH